MRETCVSGIAQQVVEGGEMAEGGEEQDLFMEAQDQGSSNSVINAQKRRRRADPLGSPVQFKKAIEASDRQV
jgi:hypothetical protein